MKRKAHVLYSRTLAVGPRPDSFENGVFWELYMDLERQFQDFLEYVPYLDGNEYTYSFRLLNLILGIGGHVDSAFKEMARFETFKDNVDCQEILKRVQTSQDRLNKGKTPVTVPIGLCLRAFESEYRLSKQRVVFKRLPDQQEVEPFKPSDPKTKAPEWWDIYNKLKHNVSVNLTDANLHNSMQALAGAFLLNVIHRSAILRLDDYGLIHGLHMMRSQLEEVISKRKMQGLWGYVETPLFIYDFEQRFEGGEKAE